MQPSRALLVVLAVVAGCSGTCGKKPTGGEQGGPPAGGKGTRPPAVPQPPEPATVTFKDPGGGLRRFQAPSGQEIVSVSASPDGASLVAVSATHAYVFDRDLGPATAIKLPGLAPAPIAVAISPARAAVMQKAPVETPEGKLYVLDVAAKKVAADVLLGGEPAFGAALAGGRIAVVLREPPALAVHDGTTGARLGVTDLPPAPTRLEVAPDGSWAAVACEGTAGADGGVVVVDVAGETPVFTPVPFGPGKPRPQLALPVGDAVLVAGKAEGDRPFAVVAPRRGGDLVARLAVGEGTVVGAAQSGDGSRVAVFTTGEKPATWVFDTAGWKLTGSVDGGLTYANQRPVAAGTRLFINRCHDVQAIDPAAHTAAPARELPSPQQGPCLVGLWRIGDRLAVLDARQVVAWPIE